jgi:hypothetical protein
MGCESGNINGDRFRWQVFTGLLTSFVFSGRKSKPNLTRSVISGSM